jgi:hypothetical protein
MSPRTVFPRKISLVRCAVSSAPFLLAAIASQDLSAQLSINVTNMTQLSAAISTVNASSTNDTINIAAGSYVVPSASANLDINKGAGTLTINGAGASTTILDGNFQDRYFHILNATSVTITDVTIRNCGSSLAGGTPDGGAILAEAGNLSLQDCVLENNSARGALGTSGANGTAAAINGGAGVSGGSASGGAIYMDSGGTLTLVNVSFIGNLAQGGDGGTGGQGMDLAPGGVGGNGGNGGSGGGAFGGAVLLVGGTATISGCLFENNTARGGDGGPGGRGGNNANTSSSSGGNGGNGGPGGVSFGGGVNVVFGTFALTACTIRNNFATGPNGGAGGAAGSGFNLDGNGGAGGYGAWGFGGGVYVDNSAATITRCTIDGNNATGGNGGDGGDSDGLTASTAGDGGAGGSGADGRGGGIGCEVGSLDLVCSTVSGNTASGGAGGDGGSGSNPIGSAPSGDGGDGGNGGNAIGGAIRNGFSFVEIDNSTLAGNAAINGVLGLGGPAGAGGGGTAGLDGGDGVGAGGGIATSGTTAPTVDSTIVADNTAGTGPDVAGPLTAGSSLFETAPTGAVTLSGSGANITGMDPGLSALGNYGGPTRTHRISATSVARNVGSNSLVLTTDQRGQARDDGSGVDMGALEFTAGVDDSSGGGGGGDGGGDDGGCSTAESSQSGWLLFGALFASALALLRRIVPIRSRR